MFCLQPVEDCTGARIFFTGDDLESHQHHVWNTADPAKGLEAGHLRSETTLEATLGDGRTRVVKRTRKLIQIRFDKRVTKVGRNHGRYED